MTDLSSRIARYSYKPGWAFRVGQRAGHEGDWLLADFLTIDANDPSKPLRLPGGRRINRGVLVMDDEQLSAWVLGLIDEMERHERDEWFMCDGVKVDDPHGEAK